MSIKLTGAKQFRRNLEKLSRDMARTVPSILAQEARAMAVEYGSATAPGPGFAETRITKFADRIESDIRRVFASSASPSAVYQLLAQRAPEHAAAYWAQHKRKNPRGMAAILREAGLASQLDPSAHRSARRNGAVPKNQQPVALVGEPQLRAYVKPRRANSGFAKAAWYVAAASLGGRVRRTTTDAATGKRKSEQIFPTSLRRIAKRNPSIGGSWISGRGINTTVTVYSSVTHGPDALIDAIAAGIPAAVSERLANSIRIALAKTARRKRPAA